MADLETVKDEVRPRNIHRQILASMSCFFAQLTIGMSFGWVSPSLVKLLGHNSPIAITDSDASTIASIMVAGGIVGPILYAWKVDWLGRKWMAFFGSLYFIISWLILIFCTQLYEIYIARIILGLGIGYTYGLIPTYTGEVTETNVRSVFGVMSGVLFALGVIFQYGVGPYVDFYTMNIINIVFPILMMLAIFWMPESPYYLVRQNRLEDAKKVVSWLKNDTDEKRISNDMEAIQIFVEMSPKRPFKEVLSELWLLSNRKAILILTVLMIGQQFNGSATVKAYFHIILQNETQVPLDSNITVLVVEVVGFFVMSMSFFMINRVGRRVLFLSSCIGCLVGTFIAGLYYMLKSVDDVNSNASYMVVVGVVFVQIFNSLAGTTIPTIIASEMSTASIRSWFGGYKAITLSVFNSISVKVFQVIKDDVGFQYAYWMYTIILLLVCISLYFWMPETRGKSLNEIQDILSGKTPQKKQIENNLP